MVISDLVSGVQLQSATIELLNDEDVSIDTLCATLRWLIPPSWPPQYNDRETRDWFRSEMLNDVEMENWLSYYVSVPTTEGRMLVGTAGYKGKPNSARAVEIGYTIISEFQRKGIATTATKLLISNALNSGSVEKVTAETLPTLTASLAVLRKCGFAFTSQRQDPELGTVLLYEFTTQISVSDVTT